MPDIRDFFAPRGGRHDTLKEKEEKAKRKRRVIDDEDEDTEVKQSARKPTTPKKQKQDSDLKDVSVSEYFAKGTKVKKAPSKSPKMEKENKASKVSSFDDVESDDDDIEMLDAAITKSSQSKVKSPANSPEKTITKSPVKTPAKAAAKVKAESPVKTPAKAAAKVKAETPVVENSAAGLSAKDVLARIPDAVLPDVGEDVKFNFHAHKAKMESAPQTADLSEVPDAAPNCLVGMVFVFTGILPTLPREACQDLVKRYGGKVTTAPSRNTTVVVLGEDAGPKKIQKIKELGIKTIDETGFVQLLRDMPADGGFGDAAKKAMEKKRLEEEKAEMEAMRMADQMAAEEKKARQDAARASPKKTKGKESVKVAEPAEPRRVISEQEKLWTVKYAPKELSDICGNGGAITKLRNWLSNWHKNQKAGFKGAGEAGFRAAILHGPPGIGKTTATHLIAKSQGYDVIESNASDTRSKTLIQNTVAKTLDNSSLAGFLKGDERQKRTCLILDEVDGMSAGDRGGVGAMAALCRTTNIPLILICNERNLPKMRPFDRVTLDIPFRRPDANAIRPRIMAIAAREGLKLDQGVVEQLVQSTRSDIRQIINLLSTFATTNKTMGFDASKSLSKAWEKEIILKPFDIVARFLSGSTFARNSGVTLQQKIELYFNDHDFAPLMVQENYLNTIPARAGSTKGGHLALAAAAADSISDGDLVDRMIHGSQQQWSLMPLHGVLSSVRPSSFVAGQGRGRFNFSAYLGNNSKAGKYYRLLQEVQSHMRLRLWSDKNELRQQYIPALTRRLIEPLLKSGAAGVEEVMELMDCYYLTKEDWDVVMELGVGPGSFEEKAKGLPTQVKSGFTRQYNAASHPVPFMKRDVGSAVAVKSTDKPDLEDVIEDDPEPEDEDASKSEEPDLTKDKYVKIAKPKGAKAGGAKKATTKAKAKGKASAK